MEDEDPAERIKRFLKANEYPVRKSDITQDIESNDSDLGKAD